MIIAHRHLDQREAIVVRPPTHRPPTHPAEMLIDELLKPLGLTQTELADRTGESYPRINELVHGKRDMTPDTALRWNGCLAWRRSSG